MLKIGDVAARSSSNEARNFHRSKFLKGKMVHCIPPKHSIRILIAVSAIGCFVSPSPAIAQVDETIVPAEETPDPAFDNYLEGLLKSFGGETVETGSDDEPTLLIPSVSQEIGQMSDAFLPIESDPFGEEAAERSSKSKPEKGGLFDDYDEALQVAQLRQLPLLVILGAEWCGWCRKLEGELETDASKPILERWVVVKIDVDKSPELAQRYQAGSLPGLRIVDSDETIAASTEGYRPAAELKEWLTENLAQVDPTIKRVLYQDGDLGADSVDQLIVFLGDRSPNIRAAAQTRIRNARSATAGAVVDTLRNGSLAQQLSAIQVLAAWKAPVSKIDPWQPDSIREEELSPLLTWLRDVDTSSSPEPKVNKADQIPADWPQQLEQLLSVAPARQRALLVQMSQVGESVLPSVKMQLAENEQLRDDQRELLRELLYRIQAGNQTRLQHATLLTSIARLEAKTHRDAATKLLDNLTSQDQPLVDELSRDTDALIRELVVAKLNKMGALHQAGRFERMLNDEHPSVRTAVLRSIADNPKEESVKAFIAYLAKEQDEDLLVFATKTLGSVGSIAGAENALLTLVRNESWRVRAAALDSLGTRLEEDSSDYEYVNGTWVSQSKTTSEAAEAVLSALDDGDEFVAGKAKKLLPALISKKSAPVIAKYLREHKDRLDWFTGEIDENEIEMRLAPLLNFANNRAGGDDEFAGISRELLLRLDPQSFLESNIDLLQSNDQQIRVAAMQGVFSAMREVRSAELERWPASEAYEAGNEELIEPWHPIPDWFEVPPTVADETFAPASEAGDDSTDEGLFGHIIDLFGGNSAPPVPPQDNREPESEPATSSDLDSLDSFFGSDEPREEKPAEEKNEVSPPDTRDEMGGDEKYLASGWLENWKLNPRMTGRQHWIKKAAELLRERIEANQDSEDNAKEHFLARAALLTLGGLSPEEAEDLFLEFSQQSDQPKDEPSSTWVTREDLLPWASASQRLELLREAEIAWDEVKSWSSGTILAATEIDDLGVASLMLEQFRAIDAPTVKQIAATRTSLLRALLGGESADGISTFLHDGGSRIRTRDGFFATPSEAKIIGRKRAVRWLTEQYQAANTASVRALLLSLLSNVDHKLASQSAVGLLGNLQQADTIATRSDIKIAMEIAFVDIPRLSVDRASQFLSHPVESVRESAAKRLVLSSYKAYAEQDKSGATIFYIYNEEPDFLVLDREIDIPSLRKLRDTAAAESEYRAHLDLLLLSAGLKELAPADLAKRLKGPEAGFSVVAALTKAERTDERAIEFYKSVLEKLKSSDDSSAKKRLYNSLRTLQGEEMLTMRKAMREEFGSEVISGY